MSSLSFKTFEWPSKFEFKDVEVIEGPPYRQYVVDGNKYPSMTSVLKVLDVEPEEGEEHWLDAWAKRLPGGHAEAKKITDDAIKRGENLHLLSELYLQNKLSRSEVKGPGAVMFNRNRGHLDKLKAIHGIEVAVWNHALQYAGRLDCLADDEEGDFCVVDHKNSRRPINIKKDYGRRKLFKYMLQCCGYSLAVEQMYGVRPSHGILIVANFITMDSKVFKFPLAPLDKAFNNLVESFYGRDDVLKNAYFKL